MEGKMKVEVGEEEMGRGLKKERENKGEGVQEYRRREEEEIGIQYDSVGELLTWYGWDGPGVEEKFPLIRLVTVVCFSLLLLGFVPGTKQPTLLEDHVTGM